MNMIANYMIIDDISLFELERLHEDNMLDRIEELADMEDDFPVCDIDKIWNGLYFLLTGRPEPNDLTSDNFSEYAKDVFIFGSENFNQKDYISYIKNKTLKEILPEIKKINFKSLYNSFNVDKFKKAEIYPFSIWIEEEKELLFEEMEMAFEEMKILFEKALKLGKNILVSIY